MPSLLGIDNGLTVTKAVIFDVDGSQLSVARVRVPRVNEGKNVVVIPERALIPVQGSFSVAVVGADHKVAIKRVELGAEVAGVRIVRSGLAGGEQLVVDGLPRMSDGAVVEPHPAAVAPDPATKG